jgi:DnaJ like chaperone protein
VTEIATNQISRKERILSAIAKRQHSIEKKPSHKGSAKSSVLIAFTFYIVAITSKFSLVSDKGAISTDGLSQLKEEIEAFKEIFSIPREVVDRIERYYVEAIHDQLDAIHAAKQVTSLFPDNQTIIEQLAKNLFLFIDACGGFTSKRALFLKQVVIALGFNENYYKRLLREQIIPQQEDPLVVLGVTENVSYVDLRKAYRVAAKEWHPDRFCAADTPKELLEITTDKFNRIQQAFMAIKLKRGFNL